MGPHRGLMPVFRRLLGLFDGGEGGDVRIWEAPGTGFPGCGRHPRLHPEHRAARQAAGPGPRDRQPDGAGHLRDVEESRACGFGEGALRQRGGSCPGNGIISEEKGIEAAMMLAQGEGMAAKRAIEWLPESEAKTALYNMVDYVLSRLS